MTTMRRPPSLLQLGPGQHRRWCLRLHHRLRHLLPLSYSSSSSSPTSPSKPPRVLVLVLLAASLGLLLLLDASAWSSVAWIIPTGQPGSATGGGNTVSSLLFPQQRQQQGAGLGTNAAANGPGASDGSGRYTVVINTWKRDDLLRRSVSHYASCPGVDAIRVVWSEPDPPSQDLRDSLARLRQKAGIPPAPAPAPSTPPKVMFDLNMENSLNNRFKEMDGLATDAIFSVDDDVILPCRTVEFAFQVWRTAPEAMVGFVPRMHWPQQQTPGGEVVYRYGGWLSVWWRGTYSMVLTKVAFFHNKYLYIYTHEMHASIRDYVTANRNCEDIAMSFLVANITKAPPLWVQGSVSEIGSFGISSLGGHTQRRTQCLNDFATIYGHMPLIPTTVKAVDSRQAWFW